MKKLASILQSIARIHRAGLDRFGSGGWGVFLFLLVSAIACAGFALFGENPWDHKVFESIDQGVPLTVYQRIVSGFWVSTVFNLVFAIFLMCLVWFWGQRRESPPATDVPSPSLPVSRRVFWILVIAAIVAGAWIRAPRLDHSFWNDEELAFRKFTYGQHLVRENENGEPTLEFQPAGIHRALFYSISGNNHVVHTMSARTSLGLWRAFGFDSGEHPFSEAAVRLPPFICGLLAIAAMAVWLGGLGFPAAGITAAWLLALHPWHLRYSVEARGYSALILWLLLALIFLHHALRTHRWRWWLGYGAAQCLYLLCFAGSAYLAVAMNLLLFGWLILRGDSTGLRRWLIACMLGAMVFLQVMTTALFTIMEFATEAKMEPTPIDAGYLKDFWSHLALGIPWGETEPGLHHFTSFITLAESGALMKIAMQFVLPLFAIAGAFFTIGKNSEIRWFFAALGTAALLVWIHSLLGPLVFFSWYAIYLVIGFVVALAFLPELASTFPVRVRRNAALAIAILIVAGYAWLSTEPRYRIRSFDRHPMRQAVESVRGEAPALSPDQSNLLTVATGTGAHQLVTYDPRVRDARTAARLESFIAEARETGKPLAVYACSPLRLASAWPEIFALLEDAELFTADPDPEGRLKGLEEFWSFRIYRLKL